MLNVCFSGAAEASLHLARNKFEIRSNNFVSIHLSLYCGDISEPLSYDKRKKVYESAYGDCAYDICTEEKDRFMKRIGKFKRVCIWFSRQDIDEYLSLLFFTEFLSDKELYICDCTQIIESIACIQHNLDKITEIPQRKKLSAEERASMIEEWHKLQAQNTGFLMLRNGKPVSLPLNYFDDIILDIVGDKQTCVNKIAEIMLRTYTPRLLDFVTLRVSQLIESGKLNLVYSDEWPIKCIVRRNCYDKR